MYDRERRRNEDMKRSEAVPHYKSEEDLQAEKMPDNYRPHPSERDEQTRPREMFSMENSYGDIAISANRDREMTVSISENRRHNSDNLENDSKQLDGQRRRSTKYDIGNAFTNRRDPISSAFAFKTRKLESEKQVLDRIKKYVEQKGQNTVEDILPFFVLEKDKKRLKDLNEESRETREAGEITHGLEREAAELAGAISRKEQMQSRFIHKMRLAITKAEVLTDEDLSLLVWNSLGEGMDKNPPEDEEDLPSEEETISSGKKPNSK